MRTPILRFIISGVFFIILSSPIILHAQTYKYRVLVAVTDSAAKYMGSTMKQDVARKFVTNPNSVFQGTQKNNPVTVELAGIVIVSGYKEVGLSTDLSRLQQNGEGSMDTVHTLRNDYAADVVALCANYNYTASGLGYQDANAAYAFHASDLQAAEAQLSASHEVGHNFGGVHDTAHIGDTVTYPYAHGFWSKYTSWPDSGQDWGTIMSYYGVAHRQWFYSNPDSTYSGVYRGTTGRCNVARLIRERASTIAAFRSSQANVTINNRSYRANEYGDVIATNAITVSGADTLKDSSELKLRATNSVTINSGFVVRPKAALTITTGNGALAKRVVESSPQTKKPERPAAIIPKEDRLNVILVNGGIAAHYSLVNQAEVEINIFDVRGRLLLQRALGRKEPGNHFINLDPGKHIQSNICIVRLKAGNTIMNRIIMTR